MDAGIFQKMKVKPGMKVALLDVPSDYPHAAESEEAHGEQADFVHLFVTDKAEFSRRFPAAASTVRAGGLFWLSYPKSGGKQKYDINRDSLWELVLPYGWHPVAQIALDETWSAIRLKRNEPGLLYEKPSHVKSQNK